MKEKFKKFILINIGLIILTCGLYFFLIPSNLAVGGTTGLAMVVSYLFPQIPISIFLAGINIFLLILAFIICAFISRRTLLPSTCGAPAAREKLCSARRRTYGSVCGNIL